MEGTMAKQLDGCRVAVLATDGFEQTELIKPAEALEEAGADVRVVAPKGGAIRGWNHTEWGDRVEVDLTLDEADADSFDCLVLPGGVMNPDRLRMDPKAVQFVRRFVDAGKPIAAICHGPWTLIEAGAVEGKRIASWPSLKTDLRNAGAEWVDERVVVDGNFVTSRKPDDIPAFNKQMIELFAGAAHGAGR
jgi:protease I